MVEEVRESVEESILTDDGIPAVVLMTGGRRYMDPVGVLPTEIVLVF